MARRLGVLIGPLFLVSSLEFLGRFEPRLEASRDLTPIAYIAWSLWLIAVGIGVLA